MIVGEIAYGLGFVLRVELHSDPDSSGFFIAEYLLIVLAPCSFIATLYMLLNRISGLLQCLQYLWIRPTRITTLFVTSDVITFLIQAGGGSFSVATSDPSKIQIGIDLINGVDFPPGSRTADCLFPLFRRRPLSFPPKRQEVQAGHLEQRRTTVVFQ